MIADIGHVALRVEDVDACVAYAQDVLGLRVTAEQAGGVHLTCDQVHTRLEFLPGPASALDHVGLIAASPDALEALAARLERSGIPISDGATPPGVSESLRFTSPDGHVFDVYADVARDQPKVYTTAGLRPTRFGHVTLTAPEIEPTERFLVEMLGFRVSDRIVPGLGSWLRCSAEHHVLAVLKGDVAGMHHYAFDVEDLSGLGRLGDLLAAHRRALIFGPGRHGPGNNLYTYHLDPAGNCVEVCADMEKVLDDRARVTGAWPATAETENLWGPLPPAGFDDLCTPNLGRDPS